MKHEFVMIQCNKLHGLLRQEVVIVTEMKQELKASATRTKQGILRLHVKFPKVIAQVRNKP